MQKLCRLSCLSLFSRVRPSVFGYVGGQLFSARLFCFAFPFSLPA